MEESEVMRVMDLSAREAQIKERKRFLDKVLPAIEDLVEKRGTLRSLYGNHGKDHAILNFEGFSFRLMRDFKDHKNNFEFVRLGIQVWHHPWGETYVELPPKEHLRLDVRTETIGFGAENCSVKFFEKTGKDQWIKTLEYLVDHVPEITAKIDASAAKRTEQKLAAVAWRENIERNSRRLGFED